MTKFEKEYWTDDLIAKVYTVDKQAGNEKIYEKYNDLVEYFVKKYYPWPDDSMCQSGYIGLFNALAHYRGDEKFSRFCIPYIRFECERDLGRIPRCAKVPL